MGIAQEFRLQGSPVSDGVAVGRLFVLPQALEDAIPEILVAEESLDEEVGRYRRALEHSKDDLMLIRATLEREGAVQAIGIIETHMQMLSDVLLTTQVEEGILRERKNAAFVFASAIREYERKFRKTKNVLFQQRIIDILDISKRILSHLCQRKLFNVEDVPPGSIVFTTELNPSDIAVIHSSYVKAFVTQHGGGSSHAALIARAKGIPYISNISLKALEGMAVELVVVDGKLGEVILNPSNQTLQTYEQRQLREIVPILPSITGETRTCDGHSIGVFANIGTVSDLDEMHIYEPGEIGLLRSEFLFLEKNISFLSEEEQVRVYSQVKEKAQGTPIVFRLFDVGGDKKTDMFLEPIRESNPFLGCRGIRFLLKHPVVFRTQIRAIFRVFQPEDVKILFPLVSDVQEIQRAKTLIKDVQEEFVRLGTMSSRPFPMGCMIEVPSVVFLCDAIVREVDFLSIGTNDLVQYTLGMDRSDPSFSEFFHLAHPSLIRMLKMIVKEAKR
ncbi:MAG: phosphoenolpyruvate--protein phosphotransferase, partial [Chlamydiae bacterium]|nr:phosphoenolpyruvate--protein phosphotransferase [Chlamydiota bacterium]